MKFAFALRISSLFFLASPSAFSANWVPLGSDARGNTWHIDVASIAGDRDRVAWKRIDFAAPQPHFQTRVPIKRVFLLSATDCPQRRTEIKAMGFLDPEGSIVDIYDNGNRKVPWPSSAQKELLDSAISLVCGGTGAE